MNGRHCRDMPNMTKRCKPLRFSMSCRMVSAAFPTCLKQSNICCAPNVVFTREAERGQGVLPLAGFGAAPQAGFRAAALTSFQMRAERRRHARSGMGSRGTAPCGVWGGAPSGFQGGSPDVLPDVRRTSLSRAKRSGVKGHCPLQGLGRRPKRVSGRQP